MYKGSIYANLRTLNLLPRGEILMIDWTTGSCQITEHFKVYDCLYLPQWDRLATESDGLNDDIKNNLISLCNKMEEIRKFLGNKFIHVHCMYRPLEYNNLVGGSPTSAHLLGKAIDYHVDTLSNNKGCDDIRALLLPKLIEFNIRMEDISSKPARNWVHNDMAPVLGNRYFKP